MAAGKHQFRADHLIAEALLVGTGIVLLLSRLDFGAYTPHLSLSGWMRGWPLLLIIAGAVLWLKHHKLVKQPSESYGARSLNMQGGNQ